MQGKTHRVGGMLCALAGYSILESKGMLINDVNPLLQLTVMYPFAIYGSTFSDLDHHWESAPSKDVVSFLINKLLHLTTNLRKKVKIPLLGIFDAKHRSWQTHSDLFLILISYLSYRAVSGSAVTGNTLILKLVSTGFLLGVISHMILDMLTPEGIWCIGLSGVKAVTKANVPQKIRLVPKSSFFSTGGKWEDIVRKVMWVICFILLFRIIYLMLPYRLNISL